MTIDRLNSMDPIRDPQKPSSGGKPEKARAGDSIAISADAAEKADIYRAIELAKAAPDQGADRIAELRAKIDDPAYINEAVLSITADKIIDQLLG
jgi:negative regulator of flagellin synthesis FlgM